eukprot:g82011.t1
MWMCSYSGRLHGFYVPYFILYVSFCLVFRIVPSAFLSCRVLKQDHPTCVASNQATNQHVPLLFRVLYYMVFLFAAPRTRMCRSLDEPSLCLAPALLASVFFCSRPKSREHPDSADKQV